MKNDTKDVAPSVGGNEPDDFEQSVDQYMTSLIQRLHDARGGEQASAGAVTQPTPARKPAEPIAWINTRADGGRTFYTSLGHIDDFNQQAFRQLLVNAAKWATAK